MTNGIVVTPYRTMTQIATESIKELIIKGSYKPGSRLIPAKLEEEFKLGRAAIREALRDLQGQGLVISVPNKGVVVAPAINPQEVQEVFEIRYELEGRASELAAVSINEPEIDKLERLNADSAGYSQASHEYFLLNRKFHMDFYQASKRTFLCQIIGQIYDRILVWRTINLVRSADIPRFLDAHRQLLQAARLHDGKKAREIMVEHPRSGYDSFVDWMKDREKNP